MRTREQSPVMSSSIVPTCQGLRGMTMLQVAALLVVCFSGRSFGQFVVQPMMIEYQPRTGMQVKTEIQLQNWSRERTQHVDLSVVKLTQHEDGGWYPLEDTDALGSVDVSKLSSCDEWIELEAESAEIPPMKVKSIKVNIHVPIRVKGFHCAGIIASVRPPEDLQLGVTIRYDLVVPVLMQIAGSKLRHDVTMADVGLDFQKGELFSDVDNGATSVFLDVQNNGNTFSRLHGFAQVYALMSNDKWKMIAPNVRFNEVPIIPGSHLKVRADLERVLPTGTYKVNGALFVDGRRARGVEKDVRYEGPSDVTAVNAEVVIHTDPEVVFLESRPGRVRSERIDIYNYSDKVLNMRAHAVVPTLFGGKVLPGNVMGEDLACAEWVEVRPAEFQIRGHGKKTVRLTARMPSVTRHSFYASLKLMATFADDGSNAGRKTAMLVVSNSEAAPKYGIQDRGIELRELAASKYIVSARYSNIGTVHVTPKVIARTIRSEGNRNEVVTAVELNSDGQPAMMLPIEARDFAAVIDFEKIPAGSYTLQTDLIYGKGAADFQRIQRPLRVWKQNGRMMAAWDTTAAAANIQGTRGGSVSW